MSLSDAENCAASSFVCALLLTACLLSGSVRLAAARPEYARKENKACLYCHVSATPNALDPDTNRVEPTTRNPRGLYYAAHDHSFEGYNELAVMGKDSAPVFHLAWKEELTDLPRRIAVADVTGDGKPRLITLNEKKGNSSVSTLKIKQWDGKAFVTEISVETESHADMMEVGHFAGAQHPAVIITEDALWVWENGKLLRKPAGRPLPLFGAARLKNGEERVLIAPTPTTAKAYRVNLDAADAAWLTDGIEAPGSKLLVWGDMHANPRFFSDMGLKEALAAGGLIGLWDVRKFGTIFLYYAKISPDYGTKPDPQDSKKTIYFIKNLNCYITFRDPRVQGDPTQTRALSPQGEVWQTPRLDGIPYDVFPEDARGSGKPGLLILVSDSASGKGRSLYFFALD